jgi:hypothetical protein
MITSREIERMLQDDIREKRKTGRGAFANSGRRGGGLHAIRQGIKMPSDILKANDKAAYKKYIGAGVVKISNTYDILENVPSLEDLNKMEFEKKIGIIKIAKELHTNNELRSRWNLSNGGLYNDVFYKFGLIEPPASFNNNRRHRNKSVPKKATEIKQEVVKVKDDREIKIIANELDEFRKQKELFDIEEQKKLNEQKVNDSGMELKFKGTFTGKTILERMLNYVNNLEDEGNYTIDFQVKENL